jgi:hypothetical protein
MTEPIAVSLTAAAMSDKTTSANSHPQITAREQRGRSMSGLESVGVLN